ncbi:mitogen-activated protein kinase kinase kinase 3 [Arabidopsis thaliana]|nr:mitogen-activated protein kinase kinase kinase 3 [Arabidopsis thaliana]AEE32963.1 mitogen-activated protein kinase kinase kinase 3 [Arabidopsis thaliana]|eukprot:NP_001185211.1 mitogen-activated protein kinase kinase kinase 3 [Arabidopsis thaliana]
MPTWWGRKSCKNKDDNHRGIISTDRDIKSSAVVVDPPLTPTRGGTPRCSREFAGASSAFSGFDSDSTEKKGHPLPRPLLSPVSIHHQDHVSGSTSGSTSVSSVSSSGSADDQSQLVASRGRGDVKFNVAAAPRSPERVSPKAATITTRPTSPRHQRLSGVVSLESSTGRNDDGRSSSECHPLPRPPTSPTSPSAVHGSRIGGGYETSPSGFSTWKKGKFLGSGTFGQVYLGFNSEKGKMCAIKEVKVISDDQTSKECLKQLNQEINLLNQLCHPNIVQYYGSELSEETLSVYLEYVSGGSIHKLLKDYGSFTEPVIQNYTRQILAGLAYLHGRNTVHRDIKGANILVDPNGEIKLADFGMAKHVTAFSTMLSFKGSPYWMAPEVVMSQNGYTHAVDIWSLGCTILEMATSKPPWSQFEGVAAIFKIGNSKDTPEIPDHLSNDAKNFIRLCLQRNPTVRPTASQLLEHPFLRNTTRVASTSLPKDFPPRSYDGNFSLQPTREPYPGRLSHDNYAKQPLSRTIKSPRENVRAITSLPVSPCSSPLRQLGPAYKSCFLSPPHPSYAFPGQDSGYNLAEFAASPFRMKKDAMMEPSSFRTQTPNSPLRSRLV